MGQSASGAETGGASASRPKARAGRRALAVFVAVLAVGVVGLEFLRAAAETAATSRANACRALTPDPVPAALAHKEAPDFQLPDATGRKWSLSALRGRPVLLNFWATWCAPCVEEMPAMEELARRLGDKAVVLAVSVDEGWDLVKRFFPRGTPLSVLLDTSKAVPKAYGTEKYPETFLIDGAGRVRHYFVNKRKWDHPDAARCLETVR